MKTLEERFAHAEAELQRLGCDEQYLAQFMPYSPGLISALLSERKTLTELLVNFTEDFVVCRGGTKLE